MRMRKIQRPAQMTRGISSDLGEVKSTMKVYATAHLLRLDVFLWLAVICYAWWPFSNVEVKQESKIKSPQIEHVAEFEVKSVEEKFLHEAQPLLSPLNQCQNKV